MHQTSSPLRTARRPLSGLLVAAIMASTVAVGIVPTPAAEAADSPCQIGSPSAAYSDDVQASPTTARVWRLYQAYFLRQPDQGGLSHWTGVSKAGAGLNEISGYFEDSDEFSNRYGNLNNADFLGLIYENVLCRVADGSGFAYWLNLLDSGTLPRGELMVLFSESDEYVGRTGTLWSLFADPNNASLEKDGYRVRQIPGGLVVDVDYSRVDVKTSAERCSVASINANWFLNPDRPNPTPIGFAVIDGQTVPGAYHRADRGVLGERYRPNGPDDERVWVYQGSFNLNSNLASKDGRVLESWRGWQPPSTPQLDVEAEWRWAAAGIPLLINGQVLHDLYLAPVGSETHYTSRHSFLAMDKDTGMLTFGSTTGMDSFELLAWAQAAGYDDLIKFDGGGSVEMNVNGTVRVAGTPRDVPVWLGVGC